MTYIPKESNYKMLARLKVSNTNTNQVYLCPTGLTAVINNMLITNIGNADTEIAIFHDNTGTTYNNDTCIIDKEKIKKEKFESYQFPIYVNENGSIGIEANKSNNIIITIYGIEI